MSGSGSSSSAAGCPHSFPCNGSDVSFDIGRAPSYVALVSSTLSCCGSLLVLLVYAVFEDLRATTAQKVITLLAVADLVTALGYVMGSVNFLVHFNGHDGCDTFQLACEVQSAITSWSSLCSFAWTLILAVHFFLLIVCGSARISARLLPLYQALAWGVPLLIIVPIAALRKLGFAHFAASNWCFVRGDDDQSELRHSGLTILIVLMAGKLWEVSTYVLVPLLYVVITIRLTQAQQSMPSSSGPGRGWVGRTERRLLAIPLLFLLLRVWGTLQFFFALGVSGRNHNPGCTSQDVHSIFIVFGILQAIGDPGQGWANAVLYILLSPTIRHRLSWKPCRTCKNNISELLAVLLESYSHTHAHVTRPTASYHKRVAVVLSSGSRPSSERVPLMGASSDSGQCYESVSCSAQPELVHCSVNVCGDNVDRSTSRELTHTAQHSLLAASDSVDRSRELTHTQHSLLAASAKVV